MQHYHFFIKIEVKIAKIKGINGKKATFIINN